MHTVFATLSCNVTGTLQGNIPIHSGKAADGVSLHLAEATCDPTVEPYSLSLVSYILRHWCERAHSLLGALKVIQT